MTTEEKILAMIQAYRFTVVALSSVIVITFVVFGYLLMVHVPQALYVTLDDYFAEKDFVRTD